MVALELVALLFVLLFSLPFLSPPTILPFPSVYMLGLGLAPHPLPPHTPPSATCSVPFRFSPWTYLGEGRTDGRPTMRQHGRTAQIKEKSVEDGWIVRMGLVVYLGLRSPGGSYPVGYVLAFEEVVKFPLHPLADRNP